MDLVVLSGLQGSGKSTFFGARRRAALVALARELGMRPVLYGFAPDVRASLARNAGRSGRARVPDVAIFAARGRLEPPDASEGFAQAFEVTPTAEGAFRIAPRPDLVAAAEAGHGHAGTPPP